MFDLIHTRKRKKLHFLLTAPPWPGYCFATLVGHNKIFPGCRMVQSDGRHAYLALPICINLCLELLENVIENSVLKLAFVIYLSLI